MAAGGSTVNIPNIAEEVILNTIKDVTGLTYAVADLRKPTYEMLHTVYSGFVCRILNISMDQLTQVPLHVMETITHPELNIDEAVGPIMFVKGLEYVLATACGIIDFTMDDLTSPTRKRTRKILSAFTNYIQFIYQHEQVKVDVLTSVDALRKGVGIYATKHDELVERISRLKAERLEKQRTVQEMNLSALKARQEEINAKREQDGLHVESFSAKVEELQNLLTVTRSSRLLKQAKESIHEHAERTHKLIIKEKLYTEFGQIPPHALKAIKSVEQYSKKYTKLEKEFESSKDKSDELLKQYRDINSEEENKRKLMKSKMDKLKRLQTKSDKNKEQRQNNAATFERKKNTIFKEIEQNKKYLDEIRAELKAVTEEDFLQKQDHSRAMKALHQGFESLERKVEFGKSHVKKNCMEITDVLQTL